MTLPKKGFRFMRYCNTCNIKFRPLGISNKTCSACKRKKMNNYLKNIKQCSGKAANAKNGYKNGKRSKN